MRPLSVFWIVVGVITALVLIGLTVGAFVEREGGHLWFYWIAPFLLVGVAGMLLALGVGYYVRVVRPETKGRPPGA